MFDDGAAVATSDLAAEALAVAIAGAGGLAVMAGIIWWMAGTMRRARAAAHASPTGSAGPAPGATIETGHHRAMWTPRDPELAGWTWSGGRFAPPDLLSGPHAVFDTTIAREIRGVFRGREAFGQVRAVQRLPMVPRSAPHTYWGSVACLQARQPLPRFFLLTEQDRVTATIRPLEVAEGLTRVALPYGTRTVLWAEQPWIDPLLYVLRPLLERRTRRDYFVAPDDDRLFVCESSGESEQELLERLRYGDDVLRALEAFLGAQARHEDPALRTDPSAARPGGPERARDAGHSH